MASRPCGTCVRPKVSRDSEAAATSPSTWASASGSMRTRSPSSVSGYKSAGDESMSESCRRDGPAESASFAKSNGPGETRSEARGEAVERVVQLAPLLQLLRADDGHGDAGDAERDVERAGDDVGGDGLPIGGPGVVEVPTRAFADERGAGEAHRRAAGVADDADGEQRLAVGGFVGTRGRRSEQEHSDEGEGASMHGRSRTQGTCRPLSPYIRWIDVANV